MFLEVDNREFATILAALRYWQRNGTVHRRRGRPCYRQCRSTMLPRMAARMSRWTLTKSTNFASGSTANRRPWWSNWWPRWSGQAPLAIAKARLRLGGRSRARLGRRLCGRARTEAIRRTQALAYGGNRQRSGRRRFARHPGNGQGFTRQRVHALRWLPRCQGEEGTCWPIDRVGGTVPAKRLLTTADWKERATV